MKFLLTFSFFLFLGTGIQAQKNYRINTVQDVDDGACDDIHCSLREAIRAANADGIPSVLRFNLDGAGVKTIVLETALPAIADPSLRIEGNSVAGNAPTAGQLIIDGQGIIENGFDIQTTDVRIYGLQIQNFLETAILVASPTLDTINRVIVGRSDGGNIFINNGAAIKATNINSLFFYDNYVGTNLSFEDGLGNKNGILIDNNWASYEDAIIRIGGSIEENRGNYFANSSESAINISYQGSAKIEGNIFGTGVLGTEELGNKVAVRTRNHRGRIDIGGSEDTKNIFAYNEAAVIVDDNNFVRVSENSFYCNEQGLSVTNNAHPVPVIENGVETIILGSAQPNDFVEVYITDAQTCNSGDCQGMIYVGTVQANSTGAWQFPGFFEFGQQMVALSRNNGRQSMFSSCFRICPGAIEPEVSNSGPYCEGDTIYLKTEIDLFGFQWVTKFTTDDVEYEWTGPDGFISYIRNPKVNGVEGEYILETFFLGCPSEPDTTEVFITSLSAEIETIAAVCRADSLTLNSTTKTNIDDFSYSWTGPNGYRSSESNPTDIVQSGTYNLTIEGRGCQSEMASVEVQNDFPTPINLDAVQQTCAGSEVNLTVEEADFIKWSGDFSIPCDTCSTINFTPTQKGKIEVMTGASVNCFAVAETTIELLPELNISEEVVLCYGTSVNLLGQTITEGGTYSRTYTAATGCDSTQTYLVVAAEENVVMEERTICTGEVYTQFEQDFSTSGTYQQQFTAANGCDSLHILELTVLEQSIVNEDFTICQGETLNIFGEEVGETTTITQTFTAANGCDSIHTVALLVKEAHRSTNELTLCAGETIQIFGDLEVIRGGYYRRDFMASNGCDSVVIYEIEQLGAIETTNHITMCEEEAKELFGEESAFPGNQTETFTSQTGCDSVVYTSYTINFGTSQEESITICGGESYQIGEEMATTSGQYTKVYAGSNGCDSTHIVNLTVLETTSGTSEFDLCAGEAVDVFGTIVTTTGTHTRTFTNQNGCDSTHTITVFVKEPKVTNAQLTICEGEAVTLLDQLVTGSTIVSKTFSGQGGCDSTHIVQVTMLEKVVTSATVEVCEATCVALYGAMACSAKSFTQTFAGSNGCDSIHTLSLEITEPQSVTEAYTICEGDSTVVFGTFVKTAGTYSNSFDGKNGCDSLHTIIVEIAEPIDVQIESTSACAQLANGSVNLSIAGGLSPYTINWSGNDMGGEQSMNNLAAGEYNLIVQDDLGCAFQQNVVIDQLPAPVVEKEIIDISCFGANDGSITLFSDTPVTYQMAGQIYKEQENGFFYLKPDEYELLIKDENGCTHTEIFQIQEPDSIVVELPPSITINLGQSVVLEPMVTANGLVSYEWMPHSTLSCDDCERPTVNPLKNTRYNLTIYDENSCENSAEVWVNIDVNKGIYVPNVFSPDNDGRNDKLTILGAEGPVKEVTNFKVFDRWGTLLYEANNFQINDEQYGWNGEYRGQAMENGVYVFYAVVAFIDGTETRVQGDITLAK
ncbi:MAG: gliding motility-associated C-terminal domain-containing protein [Bacteroidota bacterium]